MGRRLSPLVVLLVLAGCGGGGGEASARCVDVSQARVAQIEEGLTVTGGGTLEGAKAVKSDDFSKVYFISAEIQGSGMEGQGEVGTWASNSIDANDPGTTYAVDGLAKEFSDWGDGGKTDADLDMSDDGAEESKDCVGG
jgi:hypothetical protein